MSGSSNEDPSGGLFFLTSALFVGMIVRTLKPYLKLPYTVVLLIVGVLFAVFSEIAGGKWAASIHSWSILHPEYLFYMFLPPLIFSSAFEADHLIFTREIKRILLMAVPGMLLSTSLTGMFAKWGFSYGWDWSTCMAFGTMLSATDPVAVVALLKELGASKTLSLFIEGESLFNDGTAMALFIVFRDAMIGDSRTVGEAVGFFLQLSFGGAALGGIVGFVVLLLLKWMRFDMVGQITLTLTAAFGTFCIAEGSGIHVSGVIALVVLGLVVGLVGRPYLEDHHSVQLFWEMMEYLANTIVFVLAGDIVYSIGLKEGQIDGYDWGMLAVLYIVLQAVRGVTVFSLYFPLARFLTDSPTTPHFKESVVVTYSGLRGAVGLVLALSVSELDNLDTAVRDRFTFFMSGIAMLSLLVNGTTTGFLLKGLGLTKTSTASQEILRKAIDNIGKNTSEALSRFRFEHFFEGADWHKAQTFVNQVVETLHTKNLPPSAAAGATAKIQHQVDQNLKKHEEEEESEDPETKGTSTQFTHAAATATELFQAWLEVARHRLVNLVRAEYWHMFEQGYIGSATVRSLVEAASIAQQKRHEPLNEWKHIEKTLAGSRLSLKLRKWIACGSKVLLSSPLRFQFEASAAFISAHRDVEDRFRSIITDDVVFEMVRQECLAQVTCAENTLRDIEQTYPEVAGAIKTQSLLKCMLKRARTVAEHLLHGGEIQETDFSSILTQLQRREQKLKLPRKLMYDPTTLLKNVGLFHQLDPSILEELVGLASTVEFSQGDIILEQDVRAESLFIVLRGSVLFERSFVEGDEKMAAVEEVQEHLRRGQSEMSMSHAQLRSFLGSASQAAASSRRPSPGRQLGAARSRAPSDGTLPIDEDVASVRVESSGAEGLGDSVGDVKDSGPPRTAIPPLKRAPTSFNVLTLFGDGTNARVQSRLKKSDHSFHSLKTVNSSFASHKGAARKGAQVTPLLEGIVSVEDPMTDSHASANDAKASGGAKAAWTEGRPAFHEAAPDEAQQAEEGIAAHAHGRLDTEAPEPDAVITLVSGLGRGTLIGLLGMVTSEPMFMRVCAENHVVCLQLQREHIFHLLKSHTDPEKPFRVVSPLETILSRMSGMNVARIFLSKFGKVSNRDIRAALAHSSVIRPKPYRPFELNGSVILLTGRQLVPRENADLDAEDVVNLAAASVPHWAKHCNVYSPKIQKFVSRILETEKSTKQTEKKETHALNGHGKSKRRSLLSRQKIRLDGFDSEYLAADKRDYNPNMEALFETKLWAFGFIEFDSTAVYWFGPGSRLIMLPKRVEGVEAAMARILKHDEATTRRRAMEIVQQSSRASSQRVRRRSHMEERLQQQLLELGQRRSQKHLDENQGRGGRER